MAVVLVAGRRLALLCLLGYSPAGTSCEGQLGFGAVYMGKDVQLGYTLFVCLLGFSERLLGSSGVPCACQGLEPRCVPLRLTYSVVT